MKSLLLAAAALIATPAVAAPNSNFVGPRVEATVGVDDISNVRTNDINYGAGVGLDLPVGSRFTIGVEANADNIADYEDFGAAARLGYAATDNILLYTSVGYAHVRNLDGLRVGGGLELSTGTPFYGKVEYRYTDLEANQGRHAGLVGVGVRF